MASHTLRLAFLSALIVAPVTLAQTTVVTLLLPGFDNQAIEGSVIAADATATTYFLACPSGEDANDCGLATGLTAVEGPSTLSIDT
jgi:hypothetical protein